MPRQIAVVVHESILKFLNPLLIDASRRQAVSGGDGRRHADRLADGRASRHDTRRTQRRMRHGDVPPREEQIFHVSRVQTAVGNAIRRRRGIVRVRAARAVHARRIVVVHRPAAVGDHVVETPFRLDFLLRHALLLGAERGHALKVKGLLVLVD